MSGLVEEASQWSVVLNVEINSAERDHVLKVKRARLRSARKLVDAVRGCVIDRRGEMGCLKNQRQRQRDVVAVLPGMVEIDRIVAQRVIESGQVRVGKEAF